MNKQILFSIDKEENFSLIGIISPKPIYKVVYLLNNALNLSFECFPELGLQLANPTLPVVYYCEQDQNQWYVFPNIKPLKKKIKDFDYFMIISPSLDAIELKQLESKLLEVSGIVASGIASHRQEIVQLFTEIS